MLFCDHRYVVDYENGIFVSGVFVPNWWNSYGLRNDWFKSSQTNVTITLSTTKTAPLFQAHVFIIGGTIKAYAMTASPLGVFAVSAADASSKSTCKIT